MEGLVISGWGIGREMGIPTANIDITLVTKILPARGIYAGWVEHKDSRSAAVISCGTRPTFDSDEIVLEAHILNFEGDLYGKHIRLGFVELLRDIEKFPSLEARVNQIHKDIEKSQIIVHTN